MGVLEREEPSSTAAVSCLGPADTLAPHDHLPPMKPHRQVLSDFVAEKWRLTALKFPATTWFFGCSSFTRSPFAILRLLLDSSHRRHHFPTGLDR
ncbi:hypothetical protein PanWU01x14_188750 [Parasponia andersonii]|uniref:Uncharacterized protein n=1 Tax=Parasponia andersonii TaxID=3476 RepID=A0A2P5C2Z7_PARAD|nr:hypothetical protein PanWU01x14_188750 [Parasponia andersonii]